MDLRQTICCELRIPWHCLHITQRDKRDNINKALCLAHEKWLRRLLTSNLLPSSFPVNDAFGDIECELLLRQRRHVEQPWRILEIRALEKSDRLVPALRRCQKMPADRSADQDLSYSQLLHYISETNYRNMWKDAYKRYCFATYDKKSDHPDKFEPYTQVMRVALQRLYNCPVIPVTVRSLDSPEIVVSRANHKNDQSNCHPNILPALCVLESATHFYVLHPFVEHSVFDCITFSPSILGNSTSKPLFIVYQILNCVRDLHDRGLCLGDIGFADVRIDRNLWVYVHPNFWHNWTSNSSQSEGTRKKSRGDVDISTSFRDRNGDSLCELTTAWVQGVLSNYDYLMELNRLSGREAGNPNHHPVLPWIMDFTVPNGGWRDLTKSKFRLNKGDRQLDLTYESSGNFSIRSSAGPAEAAAMIHHVPHHVSDVLSEITYYVYRARRTPRSVLCRCVRSNWVPAEYPSNVQRLYEWTPDECIPEFFVDSQIFRSVHTDLPDLDVPWWAASPEDFVVKHRAALEGHHVCERLHHWIDLTFGYKLSGAAAVKAKNVQLHLVDQHKALTCGGVVQLFNQPHPHRLSHSPYLGTRPPRIHHVLQHSVIGNQFTNRYLQERSLESTDHQQQQQQQQQRQQQQQQQQQQQPFEPAVVEVEGECAPKSLDSRKSSIRTRLSPSSVEVFTKAEQDSKIVLPKDYNPLMLLNQLESLLNFTTKTTHNMPDKRAVNEHEKFCSFHQRRTRDMVVIGCLLVEIFMAPKLRALGSGSTLEQRYKLIRSLLRSDFYELPRCARQAVQLLLQLDADEEGIPQKMPTVTVTGLPPPSAHQLLQPLIQIIPFPAYFSATYVFLCKLKRHNDDICDCDEPSLTPMTMTTLDTSRAETSRTAKVDRLAEAAVTMTSTILRELLNKLDAEGLELLVPYLRAMFENETTSVPSAWHLFNDIGQVLGPQLTVKELLVPLTRLFDPNRPTPKHMKVFHRSYLLQLSIRLGLQVFLAHFTTLLIEAVGGFKDFGRPDSLGVDRKDSAALEGGSGSRKGSAAHLRSPELESLAAQLNVANDDVDHDNLTLSPYDDESSSRTEVASPWSKSDAVAVIPSMNLDAEPEIFTFEAVEDDFCVGKIGFEGDVDQFDEKSVENSSDSTSGDALSIGDMNLDDGHSLINEDDNGAPNCPSSYSEGFATKSLPKSDSFSCSVPNIPSAFLESSSGIADDVDDMNCERTLSSSRNEQRSSRSSVCTNGYNISDVATESIIWLSHRLGPVLTAKHLSRNLLRMLSLCYLGEEQLVCLAHESSQLDSSDLAIKISPWQIVGDNNSSKVSECLTSIASLYGEQFIMLQYLPHVIEIVSQAKKRITVGCEAGLIGGIVLIRHIIPYLSSKTLMDHLQDTFIREIAYPVVRLLSSLRLNYPSGGRARQVIAYKLLDALHLVGLRIGFEMTRKHLTLTLQRFFMVFSKVHGEQSCVAHQDADCPGKVSSSDSASPPADNKDGENVRHVAQEELAQAFTPELAYKSYIPFCKLAGGIHMERNLPNDELLHQLCLRYDQCTNIDSIASKSCAIDVPLDQIMSNVNLAGEVVSFDQGKRHVADRNVSSALVIGNRIGAHLEEEDFVPAGANLLVMSPPGGDPSIKIAEYPKCDITKLISKQMDNDHRHLRGNWFAYWEHEIGRSEKDNRFNFKQIELLTFVGHTSNVRAVHALDNENSLVSASKDKTVKLWSLRSHGNGCNAHVPCRFTYAQHRKSVFSVTFLESLRVLASCDSTVHVWDPFMGSCLKQFDPTRNSPVTVLAAMPAPSRVILAATTEATVRFMDVRSLQFMHDYKVSLGSAGLIRCLAVSPNGNWIAVGHSTGIISVLDVRTGMMSSTFKGHEGEILQIKAFNNDTFVTSSLDQCVSVWSADDGKLKCHLRGPTEPVHCFGFYKNEMISGTTASRIGVHTSVDSQASFSSTRLRADTFKGVLTCLTVLPLNRLLLLGADNGTIRLLC